MQVTVLVLCTGNSCRSQIAEAYLRHFAGDKARIFSAGVEAHGVNPWAIATMQEDGIDISAHRSKLIDELDMSDFDYVISVCDKARERCPLMPAKVKMLHHSFPDPATASGSDAMIANEFRRVREQIKSYCQDFVKEYL